MAAKTQQFNPSGSNLRSTIQQSINLIRGKDVSHYTLIFLDPTIKNPAGTHENIYMPNITLGRGKKCQVRYGENYTTVSREHASISIDGNTFYLNHNPGAKNPTLVNGNPINRSYPLQNGDEIQLSYDGPRLRFNTSKVKTSTIGLTSRIGSAIGQAVKPYKTAITVLGALLIVALGFAGYNMYQNANLNKKLIDSQLVIESLSQESQSLNDEIKGLERQGQANSARYRSLIRQKREQDRQIRELKQNPKQVAHYTPVVSSSGETTYKYSSSTNVSSGAIDKKKEVDQGEFRAEESHEKLVSNALENPNFEKLPKPDVVFLVGKRIEIKYNNIVRSIGAKEFYAFNQENPQFENRDGIVYGTGFYTSNKEFITARHVAQPWRYSEYLNNPIWKEINMLEVNGAEVTLFFTGFSMGGIEHAFSTKNMRMDDSKDKLVPNTKKVKLKNLIALNKSFKKFGKVEGNYKTPKEVFSDWAKLDFDNVKTSKIKIDRPKSQKLLTGRKVYGLGFGMANALQTDRRNVEPKYTPLDVSQDYTFNGVLHLSSIIDEGMSGGPALIWDGEKFIAIGVLTQTLGRNNTIVTPVQNVR